MTNTTEFYKELEFSLATSTGEKRKIWATTIIEKDIDIKELSKLLKCEQKIAIRFLWLLSDIGILNPNKLLAELPFLFDLCEHLNPLYKTESNIVKGCQSVMHLRSYLENGKIFFEANSDALISLGLSAILISIYSGETAETVLTCPPNCLEELGISASLSQNRANGLYSIHLKMKQDALKLLMGK